ncbi:MAG: signal protein PDZ, partial [Chitinophagaceae bacterium]
MRLLYLLALILTIRNTVSAQEEFVPPPAKLLTSFSFHMLTGGVITIQVQIDGHPDTLNFVLDTGSGGISLDSTTVEELKIKTELSDRTIRGIAGIRRVRFAYNRTLILPGLEVD